MGKVKVLAIDLDVEQFIQNIQERPVIWDRHIHVQKQVVYQMWKDLSRIHGLSSKFELWVGVMRSLLMLNFCSTFDSTIHRRNAQGQMEGTA